MSHPVVFVDCETTGLGPDAVPWEVAVIRRESDGQERTLVAHVDYRLQSLPASSTPAALALNGWLTRGARGSTYLDQLGTDVGTCKGTEGRNAGHLEGTLALPMRSELLAAAAGVTKPADEDRHTALGDARWAARWFDALAASPSGRQFAMAA